MLLPVCFTLRLSRWMAENNPDSFLTYTFDFVRENSSVGASVSAEKSFIPEGVILTEATYFNLCCETAVGLFLAEG